MIQMTKRKEYPYMELPQNYIKYAESCIDELDMILRIYNLPQDTIVYEQIKEKYRQLRIYFSIPKLLDNDLSDKDRLFYDTLQTIVAVIINKWEKEIDSLIKRGLL